ncbi:hypothetical protein [Pleomorphovibrio marinus]|uniref:hypothetical protein n=1 Tax=Pleomorphovibrio marinus TaxID=2164132 RepID=UPI000E0B2197|nr:hypothetical protein [Pleomorphovibrio marinus]
MGITPQFSKKDITDQLSARMERVQSFILNELDMIGLEFVKSARTKADFTDRTGNLRSSIGYLIIKDGVVIKQNFQKTTKGTDGNEGVAKAREYAGSLAGENVGYILIVVAGMSYAVYVEGYGYDVLTGSSFEAESSLKQAMERIKKL